jgi:hypothetical protein
MLARSALALPLAFACMPLEDLSSYSEGGTAAGGTQGGGSTQEVPETGGSAGNGDVLPGELLDAGAGTGGAALGDAGLLAAADAAPAPSGPCSGSGEVAGPDGQRCYFIASQALAWGAAQQACAEWGGHLVTLDSSDEDTFLATQTTQDLWLGLNDVTLEGTFVWEDGSSVGYTHWASMEPNNSGDSDCAEKRGSNGFWYDQQCLSSQIYACEQAMPSE